MTYPHRPNVAEELLNGVPSIYRSGVWFEVLAAIGAQIQRIEDQQASVAMFLSDPRACSGKWLDRWGRVVDEARDGLGDSEYLALIEGKIAALTAGGTPAGLSAVWQALAFGPVRWDMRERLNGSATGLVILQAEVSSIPTAAYRRRAGRVLERAFAVGVEGYGVLYLEGAIQSPRPGVYPTHTHGAIITGAI